MQDDQYYNNLTVSLSYYNEKVWVHTREGDYGNKKKSISLQAEELWNMAREIEAVIAGAKDVWFIRKSWCPIYIEQSLHPVNGKF